MLKSKFNYITYPFFGSYTVPNIEVEFDKISAKVYRNYALLKTCNSSDYLEELLSFDLEEKKRFKFQITALSTQELLMLKRRCLWGIDITGRMHKLSRFEKFERRVYKPYKITKDKMIWFKEISRPIITPLSIANIQEDLFFYWFNFAYIDHVWELYKVSPDFIGGDYVWI